MSRWFRYYDEALDDPKVQRLPGDDFKALFIATLKGDETVFSPYVYGPYNRPDKAEWAALRAAVFERDGFVCQYCGAEGARLECDHIVPVCKGGSSELDNLTTACKPCNRSKAGKLLEDWMAE